MLNLLIKEAYNFSKKTVVITGGSGILGIELAKAILECDGNVVILDRNIERAQTINESREYNNENYLIMETDVLDEKTLKHNTHKILKKFDNIDCLINAAGGNSPQSTTSGNLPFFNISKEALKFSLDLNLLGTIIPCQVIGKIMADNKEGNILNISSMSAYRPMTNVISYSAAKAGINNFTAWLAVHIANEYSPKIRVNAIAPGFFLTTQNSFLLKDENTGELTDRGKRILDHTPMRRFGEPKDLIGTVFWLLSPASDFVTGAVIPVDGGFNAYSGV